MQLVERKVKKVPRHPLMTLVKKRYAHYNLANNSDLTYFALQSSSAVASPTPKILFSSTAQIPLRQVSNSSAESNLDESRKSINGTSSLSEPKKIFSSNQSLYKIRDTAASAEITKNIGILIRKDYIISSSTHTTPFSVPIESSQAYESDAGKSRWMVLNK